MNDNNDAIRSFLFLLLLLLIRNKWKGLSRFRFARLFSLGDNRCHYSRLWRNHRLHTVHNLSIHHRCLFPLRKSFEGEMPRGDCWPRRRRDEWCLFTYQQVEWQLSTGTCRFRRGGFDARREEIQLTMMCAILLLNRIERNLSRSLPGKTIHKGIIGRTKQNKRARRSILLPFDQCHSLCSWWVKQSTSESFFLLVIIFRNHIINREGRDRVAA